jgi:hypothetical protein
MSQYQWAVRHRDYASERAEIEMAWEDTEEHHPLVRIIAARSTLCGRLRLVTISDGIAARQGCGFLLTHWYIAT